MQHLGWELIILETQLGSAVLLSQCWSLWETKSCRNTPHRSSKGSSMPTVKISIGHAGLLKICSSASSHDTVRDTFRLIESTCIMAQIKLKDTNWVANYLICNSTGQFVHPGTSLCNFLSRIDHIWGVLQGAFASGKIQGEKKEEGIVGGVAEARGMQSFLLKTELTPVLHRHVEQLICCL